jgi:hypothetical protein
VPQQNNNMADIRELFNLSPEPTAQAVQSKKREISQISDGSTMGVELDTSDTEVKLEKGSTASAVPSTKGKRRKPSPLPNPNLRTDMPSPCKYRLPFPFHPGSLADLSRSHPPDRLNYAKHPQPRS